MTSMPSWIPAKIEDAHISLRLENKLISQQLRDSLQSLGTVISEKYSLREKINTLHTTPLLQNMFDDFVRFFQKTQSFLLLIEGVKQNTYEGKNHPVLKFAQNTLVEEQSEVYTGFLDSPEIVQEEQLLWRAKSPYDEELLNAAYELQSALLVMQGKLPRSILEQEYIHLAEALAQYAAYYLDIAAYEYLDTKITYYNLSHRVTVPNKDSATEMRYAQLAYETQMEQKRIMMLKELLQSKMQAIMKNITEAEEAAQEQPRQLLSKAA